MTIIADRLTNNQNECCTTSENQRCRRYAVTLYNIVGRRKAIFRWPAELRNPSFQLTRSRLRGDIDSEVIETRNQIYITDLPRPVI